MSSFFAQLDFSLKDLREQKFFLLYFGKGAYDGSSVDVMNTQERLWNLDRLSKQLKDEQEAHKEAMRKARAKR